MDILLQQIINGLVQGSVYALVALGYTMVYGILKFINFAHSDVFMLGAWSSFAVCGILGFGSADAPWYAAPIALFGAMSLCAALGFTIERLAYRPLRSAPRINVLITAIGVSLLLENTGQLEPIAGLKEAGLQFPFGTRPAPMPLLLPSEPLATVAGVNINPVDVLVIGVAVALMGALQWLVFSTSLGRAMRAVSHDARTASLMGIDVDRVVSITFVIGSALAAAAGFLYGQKVQSLRQPAESVWILLGLKAFVAAVVGGIGNVRGAMAGGLMIGLVEQFGAAYLSTNLRDLYVFTLLIVVLLFKPEGLLGKATVEKV